MRILSIILASLFLVGCGPPIYLKCSDYPFTDWIVLANGDWIEFSSRDADPRVDEIGYVNVYRLKRSADKYEALFSSGTVYATINRENLVKYGRYDNLNNCQVIDDLSRLHERGLEVKREERRNTNKI